MGVKVKPEGNRRLQPVTNQFFYWLRASRLETHRLNYWWAQRMLTSPRPFEEKMALFWHGHFATTEEKVRDYRKMQRQLQLFQQQGRGNFRRLLVSVAQDPAMLAFLDAGVNVKARRTRTSPARSWNCSRWASATTANRTSGKQPGRSPAGATTT